MPLTVEVVSPERILYSGEADTVIARTIGGGDLAFLPGHAPFLGALQIAEVRLHLTDGEVERVAVHGGFVSVADDKVTVLSDAAEVAGLIDVDRARRAKEAAEKAVMEAEDVEAQAAMRRAHVRLDVAGGLE